MGFSCHAIITSNLPRCQPAINNAINEHNDDSSRRTFLSAHRAFRAARHYKWPNTPCNSTSFSRRTSLAWLPTHSTLAIKIPVIEHINYTHPETAMITISHVSMGFSHLPQNCRQRNDFSETLVAVLGVAGSGSFVILRRTADAVYVVAPRLTVLVFMQGTVIACKWAWICILTRLH